jgi:hypothetical protein
VEPSRAALDPIALRDRFDKVLRKPQEGAPYQCYTRKHCTNGNWTMPSSVGQHQTCGAFRPVSSQFDGEFRCSATTARGSTDQGDLLSWQVAVQSQ